MAHPSGKANALQTADIVGLLHEHFDKGKGAYNEGWSDEKIAEQVGCKPSSVQRVRSQHFGHLKRATIQGATALTQLTAQLENDLRALGQEHDQLVADFVQLVKVVRHMAPNQLSTALLKAVEQRYAHIVDKSVSASQATSTQQR